MANNRSAKKRIKIIKRNRLRNRFYKSSIRTLSKSFFKNLYSSTKEESQDMLNSLYSLIDKAKKKNVFHKNTAARKKARLSSYLKNRHLLT